MGETYQEALDLKGNPTLERDWYETKFKATNEPYRFTVAHWCATEARFRNHLKKVKKEDAAKLISLENMLVRVTQQDVVYRRYLLSSHRSYIPDFGVYIRVQGPKEIEYRSLSRQLVLFCVERRKAWRMLQSKAGIENLEYKAQKAILADVDAGKITKEDFFAKAEELLKARLDAAVAAAKPAHAAPVAAAKPAAPTAPAAASKPSETPRPAAPVPVVAVKPTAPAAAPAEKSREAEASPVVVAKATEVTVVTRETETESSAEWERTVQMRMMELDVDPGNDASGLTKRAVK
jgi:hypothetical protein